MLPIFGEQRESQQAVRAGDIANRLQVATSGRLGQTILRDEVGLVLMFNVVRD